MTITTNSHRTAEEVRDADLPVPHLPDGEQTGERFLPLLTAILPVLAQAIPSIVGLFSNASRDVLGDEAPEVDKLAVYATLVPHVVEAVAGLSGTVSRDVPRGPDDVAARFLGPLLQMLPPIIGGVVPDLLQQFFGHRDIPPPSVTSPEYAERFLGGLFNALIPTFVQALPSIVSVLTGMPRGMQLNWVNFDGQWLPDGDGVLLREHDIEPGMIEISLQQPYNTWGKEIRLYAGNTLVDKVAVRNANRESGVIRVPVEQVRGIGRLEFVKAKLFGFMTGMYDIAGLEQKAGKHLEFIWLNG
jgi:hypothetical protein